MRSNTALSGVASLEESTELDESVAGNSNSGADEEGHVHSNRSLGGIAGAEGSRVTQAS
jgi:hypothetical protein